MAFSEELNKVKEEEKKEREPKKSTKKKKKTKSSRRHAKDFIGSEIRRRDQRGGSRDSGSTPGN